MLNNFFSKYLSEKHVTYLRGHALEKQRDSRSGKNHCKTHISTRVKMGQKRERGERESQKL